MASTFHRSRIGTTQKKLWCIQVERLWDGSNGIYHQPIITIQGERILSIRNFNKGKKTTAPCLKIQNSTALPGLIDCCLQTLGGFNTSSILRWEKSQRDDLIAITKEILEKALKQGITTVFDYGSPRRIMVENKRAADEKILNGPRILTCNQVVYKGIHAYSILGLEVNHFDSVYTCIATIVSGGADFIHVLLSDQSKQGASFSSCQFDLAELKELVKISHSFGKKIAAKCHSLTEWELATAAGFDIINIASPCLFTREEAQSDKRPNGVRTAPAYVLSPSRLLYSSRLGHTPGLAKDAAHRQQQISANFRLYDTNIKTGVCSNEFDTKRGVVNLHKEIGLLASLTGSKVKALRSATGGAAQIMNIDQDLGFLAEGKIADLLVVQGNPLNDIDCLKNVLLVAKNGDIMVNNLTDAERRC